MLDLVLIIFKFIMKVLKFNLNATLISLQV